MSKLAKGKKVLKPSPFPHIPHNEDKGTRRRNLKKINIVQINNLIDVWEWESDNWVELYH
jgi:hypothetical protein